MSLRPHSKEEVSLRFERLVGYVDRAFLWEAVAETFEVTYITAGVKPLLGYTPTHCLTVNFWMKVCHPEDLRRVTEAFETTRVERKPSFCDHRCTTADGRVIWLHTLVNPVSVGGVTRRFEGISIDITPARSAEPVNESMDELRAAIARNIGEGVIAVNPRGLISYMNTAAERMLGWKEQETRGVPLHAILETRRASDARTAEAESPASIAARTGNEVLDREYVFRRRSGGYFPVKCTASPLRRAGRTSGAVMVFTDLSERRRMENALRESEEHFAEVAQNTLQGVLSYLPDGRVDFVNKHWLTYTGQSRELVCSKPMAWLDALHPEDRDETVRLQLEGIRSSTRFATTLRIRRASDDAYRWHFCRAVPVRDAERRVIKFLVTCTDVDDAKRAEEALREADRLKDEILAMLGHELRNPLAPIASAAHILRVGDAAARERAGIIIERQVERMGRLVDDLLDAAHVTTGRIDLHLMPMDLRVVVERAVDDVRPLIDQRGHELVAKQPDEPLWIEADADRMTQAVMHLVNNAASYTPPRGHIDVITYRDGQDAVLRVADNGTGVPPDLLPRIFHPFTQGKRAIDRAQGGLGIGLAVVKSIVELHGGTIELRTSPDQGSELIVRLPAAPAGSYSVEESLTTVSPAARPLRVLVVDDNVDLAESLALLLKASGHDVRTAHDGAAATPMALEFLPDVVFLDIGLPGMDGNDVASRMRRQAALRETTLVALTGYGRDEDRERSAEAGFDHYLTKPARFADLERILKAAESRASLRASSHTA